MKEKTVFTDEQMEELNMNPYTFYAKDQRIVFSYEFKELFIKRLEAGVRPRAILKEAGYNTDWFSSERIADLRKRILNEYHSPEGLRRPRGKSYAERVRELQEQDIKKKSTEKTIEQMQERITHLEKQVDFLKKTASLRRKYQNSDPTN